MVRLPVLNRNGANGARHQTKWYVPIALKENRIPAWEVAVERKGSLFSNRLAQALKEDITAQSRSVGQIAGLDFDPFVNSQDPSDRYEVRRIVKTGESYRIDIYGTRLRREQQAPEVVAELVHQKARWVFVNFHYPGGQDLFTLLARLRESRKK